MSNQPLILIIDDVLDNIKVLGAILGKTCRVRFSSSGEEGLAFIKQERPDLVLLDVMMPGINGYEVLEAINSDPKNDGIPVIFVTAKNDAASESEALLAGAVDFIHKPINADVLRTRVMMQLELASYRQSLEKQVQERTRQVEALNLALEERAKQVALADQAKTLFLAKMSHELRTPMSAIIGFTELLIPKTTDPHVLGLLSKIRRAANNLSATINEILDFAQIQSGTIRQIPKDFNLKRLFQRIIDTQAESALAKQLNFSFSIDPDITENLVGDSGKLEQVLLNLTSNAIKFTPAGSVQLLAKRLSPHPEYENIRIEVQDTGIGIEPAKLEHIFAPFEQADNSLSRQYGGVGLGLSINRKLVEMMQGSFGVETEPGKGSTFWVNLRFKRGQPAPTVPSDITTILQSLQALNFNLRVLLVDDDEINRSIFGYMLKEAKLNFDVANDGAEAVSKATDHHYDLILMDIQMPIMNGLDAARAIRLLPNQQRQPIIAISANAFDDDKERCFEAGMNAFLEKPVSPKIFYQELLKWLSTPLSQQEK